MAGKGNGKGNTLGAGRKKMDASKTRLASLAREHTEAAMKTLISLLASESETVRLGALKEILDRGWGKPKEFIEHSGDESSPVAIKQLPDTDSWIAGLLGSGKKKAPPASGED